MEYTTQRVMNSIFHKEMVKMKRIRGKLLEFLLVVVGFVLFVIVLPKSLVLVLAGALFVVCLIAMIKMGFFGRF
jgi:hypothetical protein